jgi:hypothetical protein
MNASKVGIPETTGMSQRVSSKDSSNSRHISDRKEHATIRTSTRVETVATQLNSWSFSQKSPKWRKINSPILERERLKGIDQ